MSRGAKSVFIPASLAPNTVLSMQLMLSKCQGMDEGIKSIVSSVLHFVKQELSRSRNSHL